MISILMKPELSLRVWFGAPFDVMWGGRKMANQTGNDKRNQSNFDGYFQYKIHSPPQDGKPDVDCSKENRIQIHIWQSQSIISVITEQSVWLVVRGQSNSPQPYS